MLVLLVAALGSGGLALALWIRVRYVIVLVEGGSMSPTLAAGDRVLVRRSHPRQLRSGDIVVVAPPNGGVPAWHGERSSNAPWFVKRVLALPGEPVPAPVAWAGPDRLVPDRCLLVVGDNPSSTDSKQLGYFSLDSVLGVFVRKVRL